MASALPQIAGGLFLSDGGLETSLVFLDKIELPHFAAFVLLDDELGRERLMGYYVPYLELCAESPGAGFVLETPTWRANPDWATLLGLDRQRLRDANVRAAQLICSLRDRWASRLSGPIVVSGVIGPRGDGYVASAPGSVEEAADYHRLQAEALADGGVDMLTAVTMTSGASTTKHTDRHQQQHTGNHHKHIIKTTQQPKVFFVHRRGLALLFGVLA